tara:strand:+ start:9137 stop:10018 length:882 start_codon:yes stop_codon:yes gene_type:complete
VLDLGSGIDPDKVKAGERLYIISEGLPYFLNEVESKIKVPYFLVTGRSDVQINEELAAHVLRPNLIRWYAVNVNLPESHPSIVHIPLGIDNANWNHDGNPQTDVTLFFDVNGDDIRVDKNILVSFQRHTNMHQRNRCYDYFKEKMKKNCTFREYNNELRFDRDFLRDYYVEIRRHKFNVCPPGAGFDCHRIWQTLILGSFPIVKDSWAWREFKDLPIWFVNRFSDVTNKNMNEKYEEIVRNLEAGNYNLDKINFDYWKQVMDNDRLNFYRNYNKQNTGSTIQKAFSIDQIPTG